MISNTINLLILLKENMSDGSSEIVASYVSRGYKFFTNRIIKTTNVDFYKLNEISLKIHQNFKKIILKNNAPTSFDAINFLKSLLKKKIPKEKIKLTSQISGIKKYRNNIKSILTEEIKKLISLGNSVNNISKYLGVSYSKVYWYFKRLQNAFSNYRGPLISNPNVSSFTNIVDKRRKINKKIIDELRRFMSQEKHKFLLIKEIKSQFEISFNTKYHKNLNLSMSTYHRLITSKKFLNFSLHKLPKYNIYYSIKDQEIMNRLIFYRLLLFY